MRRSHRWLLVASALTGLLLAPAVAVAAPTFSDPLRLGFRAGDDWEPSVAADRFGHVYAFWNHYGFDPFCPGCASPHMELQVSSDGGRTWSHPRPLIPGIGVRQDDPQIVVDPADGRTVYAAYMQGDKSSMYVARSDDFGRTWTTRLVEHIERGLDKDILAVRGDDVYLAYNAVQKIYVSASHDGGRTWSVHPVVHNTGGEFGWSLPSGGAVAVDGTVVFGWGGYEASGKPSGDVNLFVSRSRDGARTWRTTLVDVSGPPPPCGCGGWAYWGAQIAIATDATGAFYALWNASRTDFGVNRMYFARSRTHGATWSARRDVSGAPPGANNLFPAIAARGDGDVRIAWQDDRNGFDAGSDDPTARWNTWYRSSSSGGRAWSAEARLSEYVPGYPYKRRLPKPGYLEPYGDYFEIDIDGAGVTHALWGEGPSYAGPGNVWYARGR